VTVSATRIGALSWLSFAFFNFLLLDRFSLGFAHYLRFDDPLLCGIVIIIFEHVLNVFHVLNNSD
jgi:hypothetical protein